MAEAVNTATAPVPVPWLTQLVSAGTSYLQFRQQSQILDVQNERMRQGLAPLDVSQYAPGVSVGVDQSTQRTILYIGVGIGLTILASAFLRR